MLLLKTGFIKYPLINIIKRLNVFVEYEKKKICFWNLLTFRKNPFQRKTYKHISKETRKEIILLFIHFKLKLVVVEFPTIFVIKFLSGMSLPRKINGNSSVYYIVRRPFRSLDCKNYCSHLYFEAKSHSCLTLFKEAVTVLISRYDNQAPT